jgi:hypothetical protein
MTRASMSRSPKATKSLVGSSSGALVASLLLGACAIFVGPGKASAQERAAPQPPVIQLEEDIVIEGHVRKPEAFYFLRRTPFGFVIRTLDEDFLDEVVRSVDADPF